MKQQRKQIRNKFGRMYSLEYTEIPKVSLRRITGDEVSRATKGMTNVRTISEATMLPKVIVAI
jgi:hypothetical protein